jgi:hypothetical protein
VNNSKKCFRGQKFSPVATKWRTGKQAYIQFIEVFTFSLPWASSWTELTMGR